MTGQAAFAGAVVHPMVELEPAALTFQIDVLGVGQRRAAGLDRLGQGLVDRPVQSADLPGGQGRGDAIGPQSGEVQRLVAVDVADPGDDVLVEQQGLELAVAAEAARSARPGSARRSPDRSRAWPAPAARPRAFDGSNTTTSPNVRGSTNHSSSAGRSCSPPASRCSTTWVCGGRAAPVGAISTRPLIRRWIISPSPESSEPMRYLPRLPNAVIVTPVNPSISASAEVRRTVRSRPTSTGSIRRPTTCGASPRRTVSTSGSSGIFSPFRRAARRRPPRRRPARRPSSTDPRPCPASGRR